MLESLGIYAVYQNIIAELLRPTGLLYSKVILTFILKEESST